MPGYTPQIPQHTAHMTVRCGGRPGPGACERRAQEEEHVAHEVKAAKVEWNPTADRLRELAEKMPNAVVTDRQCGREGEGGLPQHKVNLHR